ncbi:hypothetical protein MAR_034145 [Mya arenaria]|uniref:Uncharacterized protein n=1 Tax=Mya arenaria TaxID=6604 RepID=A0ABY7GB40_MYAAR|nr:hypothetical protein MAR_034145 [Mya arenaria]
MFQTKDYADSSEELNKECTTDGDACAYPSGTYHFNKNMHCRPAMVPTDTCREDLMCIYDSDTSTDFTMRISFPNVPVYSWVQFFTGTNPIVPSTNANCKKEIADGDDFVEFSFTMAMATTCGLTVDAETGEVTAMIRVYDDADDMFHKDGVVLLNVKCNPGDLPLKVTLKPETFPMETVTAKKAEFHLFIVNEQQWNGDENKLFGEKNEVADFPVLLGQDYFILLAFEPSWDPSNEVIQNSDP